MQGGGNKFQNNQEIGSIEIVEINIKIQIISYINIKSFINT